MAGSVIGNAFNFLKTKFYDAPFPCAKQENQNLTAICDKVNTPYPARAGTDIVPLQIHRALSFGENENV
jgi:hypothetical protein